MLKIACFCNRRRCYFKTLPTRKDKSANRSFIGFEIWSFIEAWNGDKLSIKPETMFY